ncbi:hypothetical protein BHUM_01422c [Candidatus Burkholderia humilis]|nr:hypothetical protein BHUM_01422c [Candidatus Burkholderia humilis]
MLPTLLTVQHLKTRTGQDGYLRLADLIAVVQEECAGNGSEILEPFHIPAPPSDIRSFLQDELEASKYPRIWQAVLYSTNTFIDQIWGLLHPADRDVVLSDLMPVFLAYGVSFPASNAALLHDYLVAEKLEFVPGHFSVKYGDRQAQHTLTMFDGTNHGYDYLIWAVGTPRNISKNESQLIQNILKRGIASRHSHGGICIEHAGQRMVGNNGSVQHSLRVVGEITNGELFFVSALEIIANHSQRAVNSLLEQILGRRSEQEDLASAIQ